MKPFMIPNDPLLITVAAFALIGVVLFRCFKQFEGKRWRYTLVVSHTAIIFLIFLSVGDDAQSGLIWLIPALLDFPVSILFFILPRMDGSQTIWPFMFFAGFGGMQYYYIGKLLD